jgi:hypothetical protein
MAISAAAMSAVEPRPIIRSFPAWSIVSPLDGGSISRHGSNPAVESKAVGARRRGRTPRAADMPKKKLTSKKTL